MRDGGVGCALLVVVMWVGWMGGGRREWDASRGHVMGPLPIWEMDSFE